MAASSQSAPTLPERLLRVDEVGTVLGIDPRTVKRLARGGQLHRVVLGRRTTRYRESEVLALIERSMRPHDDERRSSDDDAPGGQPGREVTTLAGGHGRSGEG